MKNLILISSFLLSLGCSNYENINGCWHVSKVDKRDSTYLVMDIKEDTLVFLSDSFFKERVKGIHDIRNSSLFFPGDCGMFAFEYERREDKLFLKNYLDNRMAEKCTSNCCNH